MRDPIDTVEHGPGESLRYGFAWAALGWLPAGDTVASAEWTVAVATGVDDPISLIADEDSIEPEVAPVETLVRLTGGTSGVDYIVSCLMTSSDGEIGQRSLLVRCR